MVVPLVLHQINYGATLVNEGKLKNRIKTHDLIKLSRLCPDLEFEDKEIELMEILTEAIPYWGRYPIPLHFSNLKKDKVASENILSLLKYLWKTNPKKGRNYYSINLLRPL